MLLLPQLYFSKFFCQSQKQSVSFFSPTSACQISAIFDDICRPVSNILNNEVALWPKQTHLVFFVGSVFSMNFQIVPFYRKNSAVW